jgi:hypothetical protein
MGITIAGYEYSMSSKISITAPYQASCEDLILGIF